MLPAYKPRPLKNLFIANQCWANLLDEGGLRDIEIESITKMLACGTSVLGVKNYTCGNDSCPHLKYLCNTCGCRACPSCGKKATDQWIADQRHRLPDCAWQHLVFTLPDTLWPAAVRQLTSYELLAARLQRAINNPTSQKAKAALL